MSLPLEHRCSELRLVGISFDKCPLLSLLITLVESISLDIRMATPASFFGPCAWKTFFQPFMQRCVYCIQQNDGFCLHLYSLTLRIFLRN